LSQRNLEKMKRIISTLLITTMAIGLSAQVTIDRTTPPVPGPAPKLNIGKAVSFQLENGLKVIVVENHKLPTVSFRLTVDMDPLLEGDKVGYADMAGNLISAGTATMTKAQIDEEVDFVGGNLSTFSNGMFASCLTKHQDVLLALASDMLLNPAFPQEELDKLKKQAKSALKSSKTNPNAIIGNVGSVLRNGSDHPYGELQTKAHIDAITIDDCKSFYNTYFRPNISYLVIVGDVTPDGAKALANKYFGKWEKGDVPKHEYAQPKADWDTRVAFVNKPGAVQSVINVTYPLSLKPGDSDELPAKVANAILGGGVFSGRLMQNLREDKAYTYGARSSLSSGRLVGSFTAFAAVRNDVTDSSVIEFMKELTAISTEPVKQSELDLIKNNMNGTFALSLERPQTIARFALDIARYGLPNDYYDTYLERLQAITVEDISKVAKKYIRPQNAIILVVGNKDECVPKLGQFAKSGKVELYDHQANPIVETVKKPLPEGLTAATVYNDYLYAITGETSMKKVAKKYKKLKTLTVVASTKMEQMGQSFTVEMTTKAMAGLGKLEIKVLEMGMIVQSSVYNNGQGYSKNMQTGKSKLEGDELAKIKEQSMLDKDIKMAELGYTMKLISIEEISGVETYKVEVKDKDGDLSYSYYSIKDKFKVYSTSSSKGPDGELVSASSELGDYKEAGESGIKFPYKRLIVTGEQEMDFKVSKIEVNEKIDKEEFKIDED
jgi:zinc protease